MEKVLAALQEALGAEAVFQNVPMRKYTSFQTGGPAELLILPKTAEEVRAAIVILHTHGMPYTLLGNGTNVLISDRGISGAVIQLCERMREVTVEENRITAQAGATLPSIAAKALAAGLGGFEFASGIPGSIGGAVCMNAGAYGGEMKHVLQEATVLTPKLTIETYSAERLALGYRTSCIAKEGLIVLGATLLLTPAPKEQIQSTMAELSAKRREKQPLTFPSAGSTFKRPEGYFAGKLVEDAGLKGFTIGGAQISELHAGFLLNLGHATSQDLWDVIHHCQAVVLEKFGVKLEPEVRFLGEFEEAKP